MKFQLFGKLRDDGEEAEQEDQRGFGAQNPPATEEMSAGTSLEKTVQEMFQQGYNEDEIKNELAGQYADADISDAINRAVANEAKGNEMAGGPEPMSTYNGEGGATSPIDEGYDEENDNMKSPQPEPMNAPRDEKMRQEPAPRGGEADPATEELVETVVEENMGQILEEFENAYTEIDQLQEKVEDLEERVDELEIRDDEDQQQFVQKVDEMEDHVDEYQSRIGGLEKAFQQVLPSLVENVRDLTELVQEIKDEKGIETEGSVSNEDIENIDVEDW